MKKNLLVLIIFFCGMSFLCASGRTQDLGQHASLKEPQIRQMPDQKMLVVESKGDPNVAAQSAFGLLYKTFFSLPGARMAPPRARWLNLASAPKSEWLGLYGLPLSDQVTTLPPGSAGARIEVWKYGEVAEILHICGYDQETPTIEKLIKFIKDRGYEIAGPHEEEYLKGPESGPNAAEYQTIIRYQVKKQ